MRRTIKTAAFSALAVGSFCAYARLVEKRSPSSKAVELLLPFTGMKKVLSSQKAFDQFYLNLPPEKTRTVPDQEMKKFGLQKLEDTETETYILRSKNPYSTKQVLYFQGGAYGLRFEPNHWSFLRDLSNKLGVSVVVPVYPKPPNHTVTESYDAVFSVYKELLKKNNAEDIILVGESAGGMLALGLTMQLREKGMPQPGHTILLSPWLDGTMSNTDYGKYEKKDPLLSVYGLKRLGKIYAGDLDPADYRVSPVNGNLEGLGEISLFTGTHELFLPDARNLKEKAHHHGITFHYYEYPKMNHVFPVWPIAERKRVLDQLQEIVGLQDKEIETKMRKND